MTGTNHYKAYSELFKVQSTPGREPMEEGMEQRQKGHWT